MRNRPTTITTNHLRGFLNFTLHFDMMKFLDYIYFILSRDLSKNLPSYWKNGVFTGVLWMNLTTFAFLVTWTVQVWVFLVIFFGVIVFVESVYDETEYKRLRRIEARYAHLPPKKVRRMTILGAIWWVISLFLLMLVVYLIVHSNK